ncbi:hypothetical protein E3P84_00672 [Wallemia ichthyophaga]|nr:hypothetical protein E3P84_00672 [Wallemia ichthyophaga]
MLDAVRKYGLSAVVVLLVIFTSHAFHTLHLHFTHNGFYVLFLLCFFISYYRACVVEPGYVSSNVAESRVHEWERKSDGSRRFCRKCRLFKPVLNRCVGFYNYKYFLLLLFYAAVLCLYAFAMTVYTLVRSIKLNMTIDPWYAQIEWAFAAVETCTLGLALLGFWIWHCTLVGRNKTTIEALETDRAHRSHSPRYTAPTTSPDSAILPPPPPSTSLSGWERSKLTQLALVNIFDRGCLNNFMDVLGWDGRAGLFGWWVWFVPFKNTAGAHTQPDTFTVETQQALKVSAIREELDRYWYR